MSIDPVAYEAAIAQRDRYSAQLEVARETIRSLQNTLAAERDDDAIRRYRETGDHGQLLASSGSEREQAGEHLIDWHDLGAILSDEDYREWRGRILAAIAQASSEREQELTNALQDLVAAVDAVCDGDSVQPRGAEMIPPHARSVLELALQRTRAALAPAVEEQR